MRRRTALAMGLLPFVPGVARAADAAPLPISIGMQTAPDWELIAARGLHLFEKVGLAPTYLRFTAGAAMMAAAESKSIDVAVPGTVPFIAGLAQGIPWVAIGIDVAAANGQGLVVRKGAGIHTLADLKGKRIGYYRASTAQYGLYIALKQNHIPLDQVTLLSLAPSAQVAAMRAGQIDAAVVWEPWMHKLVAEANGKRIADEADLGIKTGSAVYAVRRDWLATHQETAQRFVAALLMADDAMQHDPQPVIDAFAAETGITKQWSADVLKEAPPPQPARWLDPSYDQSMVKGGDMEHALKDLSDFLYEQKIIPKPVDVSDLLDTSVIAAVLRAQHGDKAAADTAESAVK